MNPSTASNGNEWQTAGKPKSAKPKPKPQPQPSTIDSPTANGHASGDGPHINNHSNQNGSMQNGGSRRGGSRQSSAGSYGGGRSNHTNVSNAQHSRATSSKEEALSKRQLLEKEAKNITKHDADIERVGKRFDEELEKSRDRLRQAFNEIRNQLNERERVMLEELDNCKKQGDQILRQREQRAKELKEAADHPTKMSDRQMDDLRNQIRRFVNDRRFEEDLGAASRFRHEPDRLIDVVKNYGEVVAIGGGGVAEPPQKHSSMSSLVSSGDGDGVHVGGNKSVTEIALGGIMMKSDSMDADQLVELTRSLRENLKLQGIAEDILPEVCGASVMMPARRRPPPQAQRDERNGGRGGGPNRNGGVQRR